MSDDSADFAEVARLLAPAHGGELSARWLMEEVVPLWETQVGDRVPKVAASGTPAAAVRP